MSEYILAEFERLWRNEINPTLLDLIKTMNEFTIELKKYTSSFSKE